MFFHIDESGNTGNNLFDSSQPVLSYGVLSSKTNVDALGRDMHKAMLAKLGVDALHAAELGIDRIEKISPMLIKLQNKMKFEFDYYFIEKPTYALVQLFESVFDAGLNKAVMWQTYWTPMRFYVIGYLSHLVDEALLRKAWDLCIARRIEQRFDEVITLLDELKRRVSDSKFDARAKEMMINALDFGMAHPQALDFGTPDPKIISPNAVGFQFVVSAMARQLRKKGFERAVAITLDHQQQFNAAQIKTHEAQRLIAQGLKKASTAEQNMILHHPLYAHLMRDEVFGRGIPQAAPLVSHSSHSVGLQIVDVYLWIANRIMSGSAIPEGMSELASLFMKRMNYDGIWMDGMMRRWRQFENNLPLFDELTEAQLEQAKRMVEEHRKTVSGLEI